MKTELDTAHYDRFSVKLSKKEIKEGVIRIDPYRVAEIWKLGERDNSGCLFHILKTIARSKVGNSAIREMESIAATIKRKLELIKD